MFGVRCLTNFLPFAFPALPFRQVRRTLGKKIMDSAQITELMWKNVSEASAGLQKGLTFYLAILAGTVGYLFSADLTTQIKHIVIISVFSISFFTAIASVSLAYGIWIGLGEISEAATSGQEVFCHELYRKFVKRARYVGIIVMVCLFGVLLTILIGLLSARP